MPTGPEPRQQDSLVRDLSSKWDGGAHPMALPLGGVLAKETQYQSISRLVAGTRQQWDITRTGGNICASELYLVPIKCDAALRQYLRWQRG